MFSDSLFCKSAEEYLSMGQKESSILISNWKSIRNKWGRKDLHLCVIREHVSNGIKLGEGKVF